ncbi:MAG: hypothetical protein J6B07_00990, partial [Opitutales bacterium]|nr:hypothetical protein [Opitutales bacterium]
MVDNRKYGYTFSVALHILIALAMFAWALLDVLFPKESTENKIVFDMVEPSSNPPEPPPPPPSTPDEPLVTDKIEEIEPLDIIQWLYGG